MRGMPTTSHCELGRGLMTLLLLHTGSQYLHVQSGQTEWHVCCRLLHEIDRESSLCSSDAALMNHLK